MASSSSPAEEVGSHAGTLDLTGGNNPIPDSSRSYRGGTARQNKSAILGCVAVAVLFAVAIALSVVSLQQSSEALDLANQNVKAIEEAAVIVVPQDTGAQGAAPAPAPETPADPVPAAPGPTPEPVTPKPTPTEAPTEPHELNPEWFQATHADWKVFNASRASNPDIHSHSIAFMVCNKREKEICTYEVYCPNRKGSKPFHGGPPKVHNWDSLEETQWAPFGPATQENVHINWVQIGEIEEGVDGANEENNYGRCWRYNDYYAGNDVDIEEVWGEEHRMWMLCCDIVDDGGGGV